MVLFCTSCQIWRTFCYSCSRALTAHIHKPTHTDMYRYAHPFLKPVDIEAIPGYADVISNPMDLSTVQDRLASEYYLKHSIDSGLTAYEQCFQDVELIWKNCIKFNDPESQIANDARELREYFRERYENSISIPMQMWSDRHKDEDSILSKRMYSLSLSLSL